LEREREIREFLGRTILAELEGQEVKSESQGCKDSLALSYDITMPATMDCVQEGCAGEDQNIRYKKAKVLSGHPYDN
jgi:hypothetical protein